MHILKKILPVLIGTAAGYAYWYFIGSVFGLFVFYFFGAKIFNNSVKILVTSINLGYQLFRTHFF